MRPRLLTTLAAGALTVSLLGPAGARADEPTGPGPSTPPSAREHAAAVLDEAQAVLDTSLSDAPGITGAEGRDATLVLNQLMRVRDDLSPLERQQADRLFARPYPGTDHAFGGTFHYDDGEEPPLCAGIICVHYATRADTNPDTDAPPTADTDPANGIPDYVELALATAREVNRTYLEAGYRRPDSDGTRGGSGPGIVDIYLADVGAARLYGYCTADQGSSGSHRPAYCVVDDDFSTAQFLTHSPEENLQVTLAHEYFHAVQFAYDYFEDAWVSEATATWAEDEVYDDVNDNRQYLPVSQLRWSTSPLDRFSGTGQQYGNWIFVRNLTERFTAETGALPTLVRELWEKMSSRPGDPDLYSTQAIQSALADRGTDFTTAYARFAVDNRRPAATYEEGSAYRAERPDKTWTLSRGSRSTGESSRKLDHLTNLPLRFKPGRGLGQRSWKLKVQVDMPPGKTAPAARVTRVKRNGDAHTSTIRLRRRGNSATTVGFSGRTTDYVELVLVNASRRVRACGSATDFDLNYWACFGQPRDNNLRSTFKATAVRR